MFVLNKNIPDFEGTLTGFERILNYHNSGYIRKYTKYLVDNGVLILSNKANFYGRKIDLYKINKTELNKFIDNMDEFKLCYYIILNRTFVLSPVIFPTSEFENGIKNKYINNKNT